MTATPSSGPPAVMAILALLFYVAAYLPVWLWGPRRDTTISPPSDEATADRSPVLLGRSEAVVGR